MVARLVLVHLQQVERREQALALAVRVARHLHQVAQEAQEHRFTLAAVAAVLVMESLLLQAALVAFMVAVVVVARLLYFQLAVLVLVASSSLLTRQHPPAICF